MMRLTPYEIAPRVATPWDQVVNAFEEIYLRKGGNVMELTPKEAEIFRELLSHHGIDTYRVEIVPEGKFLPGGSYPGEITMKSGEIITPTSLYEFWFDWVNGHYSLGEEDGLWKEMSEDTWSTTPYYDPDYTRKVQAQLRESISHES